MLACARTYSAGKWRSFLCNCPRTYRKIFCRLSIIVFVWDVCRDYHFRSLFVCTNSILYVTFAPHWYGTSSCGENWNVSPITRDPFYYLVFCCGEKHFYSVCFVSSERNVKQHFYSIPLCAGYFFNALARSVKSLAIFLPKTNPFLSQVLRSSHFF